MRIENLLHIAADSQKMDGWTDTLGQMIQSGSGLVGHKFNGNELLNVAGGKSQTLQNRRNEE